MGGRLKSFIFLARESPNFLILKCQSRKNLHNFTCRSFEKKVKEDPDFNAADESAVSVHASRVFLNSEVLHDRFARGDSHHRAEEEAPCFHGKI